MGVFFPISKRKTENKGKGERNMQSNINYNNLALILTRVIFFGEPADDPYAFPPLKRISTVDLIS